MFRRQSVLFALLCGASLFYGCVDGLPPQPAAEPEAPDRSGDPPTDQGEEALEEDPAEDLIEPGDEFEIDHYTETLGDDDDFQVPSAEEWAAQMEAGPLRFEPELPFAQVGWLMDGDDPYAVSYRVRREGTWGDWKRLEPTWHEAPATVGRVFIDPPAEMFELQGPPDAITFASFAFYHERAADPDRLTRDLDFETPEEAKSATLPAWVIRRAGWGARNPGRVCGSAHTPRRMTVHHTATVNQDSLSPAARMRQMQAYHIDSNGWCDFGYHFVVGIDGQIYEGRNNWLRTGAHVAGQNTNNVGISVVGNFEAFTPREIQMESAARILAWVAETHNIPLNRTAVRGHREYAATACPGARLFSRMDDLLDRARTGTSPPPQTPPPQPPPPQTPPPVDPPPLQSATLLGFVREGSVSNESGGIPNATVRLQDGRTATTNAQGLYRFDRVPLGTAEVTVEADGFAPGSASRVIDRAHQTFYASVALRPPAVDPPTTPPGTVDELPRMSITWERLGDGSWKFQADAAPDVVEVAWFIDGLEMRTSTDRASRFDSRYRFQHQATGRRLEALGRRADGTAAAWAMGVLDVSAEPAFFVRSSGEREFILGIERAPWAIGAIEVRVDGFLLNDLETGASRPFGTQLRYRFMSLGERQVEVRTFDRNGNHQDTYTRTVVLR